MAPAAVESPSTQTPPPQAGSQFVSAEDATKAPAGVILPPKDIQAIVEKTAGYVARNGEAFENRIRDKERANPKFSFLNPADPYHAFYAWRLSETRAGRSTALAAGRTDGSAAAPVPVEPEKPKGPIPPPEFQFSARMPPISAQDLDILRLTALFVAKNGRQFMTTLSQREARNYQFDFLRPNHSFFQYFNRLVDQYTLLLNPSGAQDRVALLEKNIKDKFHLLDDAKQRSEWVKFQEEEKKKMEEKEDEERMAYAQIDWHDFVVVETIVFTPEDDNADLPPPTSLSDLQHASLEQKAMMALHPSTLRIEEAMPTDEWQEPSMTTAHIPPPVGIVPRQAAAAPVQDEDEEANMEVEMEPDSGDDDDETARIRERREAQARAEQARAEAVGGVAPMKIRSDYVPRAAAAASSRRGQQMAICPNCKQSIPLNELDQHMRIELLDPRWKEQKARSDAKFATTNLSTTDVAANLKRLASQRADLFDTTGASGAIPDGGMTEEEKERAKKRAMTSWDGHADSRETARMQNLQSVNVKDQIASIHQKYAEMTNPAVGPRRG